MDIYIFFVIILFVLAISDLIVGVSNDAVNFLISAIGSKAAPFWIIMAIASIGIIIGATFSSGMMEVARKGIFNPTLFSFNEIVIIFMAVMLTDILLLDLFNTFGMPTSTTVSIVFELLGGAVAVAFIKIKGGEQGILGDYINTASAIRIVKGILLSVIVSFSAGMVIQYITRVVFTFRTKNTLKYFGAIWGGIAITSITYFILVKGLKGSAYAGYELNSGITLSEWVKENTLLIMIVSFISWSLILQILRMTFKIHILKVVVLAGTFALAMAFAGNDLVNFIGVPLAGLKSYQAWMASGVAPEAFSMGVLAGKVNTPPFYLVLAGLIMVATLTLSKKSRAVTKTSIDLSRQSEGEERFGSSFLSRFIVRTTIFVSKIVSFVTPTKVQVFLAQRKNLDNQDEASNIEGAGFDLIRASVNLVVASIVISLATSRKLPLSTTYVTFMVAMGTSLADGAWGRESAVYRITGVFSVIAGWFLTAIIAFVASALVALFISWAGIYGVITVLCLIAFLVVKNFLSSRKKIKKAKLKEAGNDEEFASLMLDECNEEVVDLLEKGAYIIDDLFRGLIHEKRKLLRRKLYESKAIKQNIKQNKEHVYSSITRLSQDFVDVGHYYVQVTDYLLWLSNSLLYISKPIFEHVDNNHKGVVKEQEDELNALSDSIRNYFDLIKKTIKKELSDEEIDKVSAQKVEIMKVVDGYRKNQIVRIKNKQVGTKNSMLYLNIMSEVKNLLLHSTDVVKKQSDFIKKTTE